jgi:GNAT superfamily N-acetyltransferase
MFDIVPCTGADIRNSRADLIRLLQEVVDSGSSVSFLAPLDLDLAAAFWDKIADEIDNNQRIVVLARVATTRDLLGCAHLVFAAVPNGAKRAEVQKVLVFHAARRKGVGRAMLFVLDILAWRAGRTLLVLDTARDSGAEKLYEHCGYTQVGVIPNYAMAPYGGFVDTVVYYKQLAPSPDTPISHGVPAND